MIHPVRWWRSDEDRYKSRGGYVAPQPPTFHIEAIPVNPEITVMIDRYHANVMKYALPMLAWDEAPCTPIEDIERALKIERFERALKIERFERKTLVLEAGSVSIPIEIDAYFTLPVEIPAWQFYDGHIHLPFASHGNWPIRVLATRKLRRAMRKYKRKSHKLPRCYL